MSQGKGCLSGENIIIQNVHPLDHTKVTHMTSLFLFNKGILDTLIYRWMTCPVRM